MVVKVAVRYSSFSDYAVLRVLLGFISLLVVFIFSRKLFLPRKEVLGMFLTGVQLGEAPTLLEALGMMLIIGALVLNSIQAIKPQGTT